MCITRLKGLVAVLAVCLLATACQTVKHGANQSSGGNGVTQAISASGYNDTSSEIDLGTSDAEKTGISAGPQETVSTGSKTNKPIQTSSDGSRVPGGSSVTSTAQDSSNGSVTIATTASKPDSPYRPAPADGFPVCDIYGMRGISIIGDSISHGANAPIIPDQSYVGLFKKAVNNKWQGGNYGFVSLMATLTNSSGTYREIHTVSKTGSWETLQTGDFLGCYAFRSGRKGDCLYVKPKTPYRYFAVFYEKALGGGSFEILVNGASAGTVNTHSVIRDTAVRTGFHTMGYVEKPTIQLVNADGKPVTITGVGYYNSQDGIVVNNYSRSGLQLIQLQDDVIRKMCQASVVVFALGHNDMWQAGSASQFAKKIDVVIEAVKKNKCRLIVEDFTWGEVSGVDVRRELKRLAEACGGDFHEYAVSMKGKIQDGSHPYPSGHQFLADTLCTDFGLK